MPLLALLGYLCISFSMKLTPLASFTASWGFIEVLIQGLLLWFWAEFGM
ncbi:4519_t:CDS:1, partial [Dentiscutata erythropus]